MPRRGIIKKHMPKTKNQKGFASTLLLLIAVAAIGYFSYKSLVQVGDNPRTEGFKKQIDKAEDIAKLAAERAKRIENQISDYADKAPPEKENKINVIMKIISKNNPGEYSKKVDKGISVLDLMELIGQEDGLSFKYRESDSGTFMEEINGVKNNPSANAHWLLYVNGKITKAGPDYRLSGNDIIEWRYESVPELW